MRQGFLHVWGDSGPSAAADAAQAPLMLVPQLDPNSEEPILRDGSPTLDSGKRYLRDLPYGWDFLVENLIGMALDVSSSQLASLDAHAKMHC